MAEVVLNRHTLAAHGMKKSDVIKKFGPFTSKGILSAVCKLNLEVYSFIILLQDLPQILQKAVLGYLYNTQNIPSQVQAF
jgi:hypothetical protein